MTNSPKNLTEAVTRLNEKRDNEAAVKLSDSVFARYSKPLDCVILSQGEDVLVLKWADFELLKEKMHVDRKNAKGY